MNKCTFWQLQWTILGSGLNRSFCHWLLQALLIATIPPLWHPSHWTATFAGEHWDFSLFLWLFVVVVMCFYLHDHRLPLPIHDIATTIRNQYAYMCHFFPSSSTSFFLVVVFYSFFSTVFFQIYPLAWWIIPGLRWKIQHLVSWFIIKHGDGFKFKVRLAVRL